MSACLGDFDAFGGDILFTASDCFLGYLRSMHSNACITTCVVAYGYWMNRVRALLDSALLHGPVLAEL